MPVTWPTDLIENIPDSGADWPSLQAVTPLDTIRGNVNGPLDVSTPPPENRVAKTIETRTDELRDMVNLLTDFVNILEDTFMPLGGGIMRGDLDLNGFRITGLEDGTDPNDLATVSQLQDLEIDALQGEQDINGILRKNGTVPMQAELRMTASGFPARKIINHALVNTSDASGGITKQWFDEKTALAQVDLIDLTGGVAMIGPLDMDSRNTTPGATRYFGIINLPVPTSNDQPATKAYAEAKAASIIPTTLPVGVVIGFFGDRALLSNAWLALDGSEVNKTTYPDLYAVCGDAFGAASSGFKFRLPDLRGRAICHSYLGTLVGADALNRLVLPFGVAGGLARVSLGTNELAPHEHGYTDKFVIPTGAGAIVGPQPGPNAAPLLRTLATGSSGVAALHDNIQPTIFAGFYVRAL